MNNEPFQYNKNNEIVEGFFFAQIGLTEDKKIDYSYISNKSRRIQQVPGNMS